MRLSILRILWNLSLPCQWGTGRARCGNGSAATTVNCPSHVEQTNSADRRRRQRALRKPIPDGSTASKAVPLTNRTELYHTVQLATTAGAGTTGLNRTVRYIESRYWTLEQSKWR
ncbi:hypothetical protein GCM10018793_67510 [Streptomyces sulfonofaciens]|uniref:Uncharacterized protein n=1 Tax=Streptomyces sulfonofaciens TaxID=68272 RepID=A0A919GPB4_9ACTN|nr:hypothetical protein GCM10018793_67510 [Streptomyces sulfonofaciens]